MKQTIVLNRSERSSSSIERIKCNVVKPVVALARIYSAVLEEPVSVRQTLLLCNVQLSFLALVMANSSLLLRFLCLVWFIGALLKCRGCGLVGHRE